MKLKLVTRSLILGLLIGVAGCSRTVEDVAGWKAAGNIEKLKDALTDPKEEVRVAAAESLGSLKAANAAEVLGACLNDPEKSVQSAAVDALIAIGGPESVMPLIAALKLDSSETSTKAAEALGKQQATAAVEGLCEALNSPGEALQRAACKALGAIGDDSASSALIQKMDGATTSHRIKLDCINALAGIGGDTALAALVGLLADNEQDISERATTALLKIGSSAIPAVIGGLKDANPQIREAAIKLLRGLNAIPTRGEELVWYQLARASLYPEQMDDALALLKEKQASTVPTIIDAATLNVPDIQEVAVRTLCVVGPDCSDKVLKRYDRIKNPIMENWYGDRSAWAGAPSPLLDLWGAASALNPELNPDRKTIQALQAGGSAANRIMLDPDFTVARVYVPYMILGMGDEGCGETAKQKLAEVIDRSMLPLIAALASTNTPVAESAAELLSDLKDMRTLDPLISTVERRQQAGEILSKSTVYTALIKLNDIKAEPLLLKVRPNTDRAIQIFSRQFTNAKITAAVTTDTYTDNEAPVKFHVGYLENNKPGTLEVTFKKDEKGNWYPSPALPYKLPTK